MIRVKRITLADDQEQISAELDKSQWETVTQSADLEQLQVFLSDKKNILLLAYDEDQVAGMVVAHQLDKLDKRKSEILLYEIEVKPTFRRRGIGKKLIEKLFDVAKESRSGEVWVLTEAENRCANGFYQSLAKNVKKTETMMYSYSEL